MMAQYYISVAGESMYRVTLRDDDISSVVIPTDEPKILTFPAGGQAPLILPDERDTFLLKLDGLVSDGQVLRLSGGFGLSVATHPAAVDKVTNLTPARMEQIELATGQSELEIVRQLAADIGVRLGFAGAMTVERILDGMDDTIGVATYPGVLSGSVYAMVSDWTDEMISALVDKTLDEMIYKEV